MHVSEILLKPKALNNRIACAEDLTNASTQECLIVEPHASHLPFGSLIATAENIAAQCHGGALADAIRASLAELGRFSMSRERLAHVSTLDNASLTLNGTHAALRRVTRETTPICVAIDPAATALRDALHHLQVKKIVIGKAEAIDRLSLKVLVRASLLEEKTSRLTWAWDIPANVGARPADGDISSAMSLDVRNQFLATVKRVLRIDDARRRASRASDMKIERFDAADGTSIGLACHWLSVQKYDSALAWAGNREELPAHLRCDALRIFAMAATNVGFHDSSLRAFAEAEKIAGAKTIKAHLAYMQGLILAKRKRNILGSDEHYRRGLEALDAVGADDAGDANVERAWLYNGMALNVLLKARSNGAPPASVFLETFGLLKRASQEVRSGAGSDRVYLRFNLLKNMSNFLEIQGKHEEALYAIEAAFDSDIHELPDTKDWNAHLATRKAALLTRTAQYGRAIGIYEATIDYLRKTGQQACIETVRRSLGTAALMNEDFSLAATHFEQGLREALAARSLTGLQTHGLGLIHSLAKQGKHSRAIEITREIADEENVHLVDLTRDIRNQVDRIEIPVRLYGLPTSLPEIDLENLSDASVSRTLHGGTSRTSTDVAMSV